MAYFYLRAFDLLSAGGHFGLIATNTIAQGDTREVGLDQIAARGGKIHAANPSQKWPGVAALEVALVHIVRGEWENKSDLAGKSVASITPYLSEPGQVLGNPHRLKANAGKSFQGSIVLGMGFVLTPEEAQALIEKDAKNAQVLAPYLNGEDLNSRPDQSPSRWVINFFDWPLSHETAPADYDGLVAEDFPDCLKIVERLVKPERDVTGVGSSALSKWWLYERPRLELYEAMASLPRAFARSRVANIHSVAVISTEVVASDATVVFATNRYAFFTSLQSTIHIVWLEKNASTMRADIRYTSSDCFETFPFPHLDAEARQVLEGLGESYFAHRQEICTRRALGLTKVYNLFHNAEAAPGAPSLRGAVAPFDDIVRLRDLHGELDRAVCDAYGWRDLDLGHGFHQTAQGTRWTISAPARAEVLDRLLALNHERFAHEVAAGLHEKKSKSKSGQGTLEF